MAAFVSAQDFTILSPKSESVWYANPYSNQPEDYSTPFRIEIKDFEKVKNTILVRLYTASKWWDREIGTLKFDSDYIRKMHGIIEGKFNKISEGKIVDGKMYKLRVTSNSRIWKTKYAESDPFKIVRTGAQSVPKALQLIESITKYEAVMQGNQAAVRANIQFLQVNQKKPVSLTVVVKGAMSQKVLSDEKTVQFQSGQTIPIQFDGFNVASGDDQFLIEVSGMNKRRFRKDKPVVIFRSDVISPPSSQGSSYGAAAQPGSLRQNSIKSGNGAEFVAGGAAAYAISDRMSRSNSLEPQGPNDQDAEEFIESAARDDVTEGLSGDVFENAEDASGQLAGQRQIGQTEGDMTFGEQDLKDQPEQTQPQQERYNPFDHGRQVIGGAIGGGIGNARRFGDYMGRGTVDNAQRVQKGFGGLRQGVAQRFARRPKPAAYGEAYAGSDIVRGQNGFEQKAQFEKSQQEEPQDYQPQGNRAQRERSSPESQSPWVQ